MNEGESRLEWLRRSQLEMKSMSARLVLQSEIDMLIRVAHLVARAHAAGLLLAEGVTP